MPSTPPSVARSILALVAVGLASRAAAADLDPPATGPAAGGLVATLPKCTQGPGLQLHRASAPLPDRMSLPSEDPWPVLTPSASSAAWARVRADVRRGRLPPRGAVRAEEIAQMSPPDEPPPRRDAVVVRAEAAAVPWAEGRALVRIAVTARAPVADRPPAAVVAVVDARTDAPDGLNTARAALGALIGGLRPDDALAVVDSARGVLVPLAPVGDGAAARLAVDGAIAVPGAADLVGAFLDGWGLAEGAGGAARVVLVSDGEVSLIEREPELVARIVAGTARGVGLAAVGTAADPGRDESLEGLVRAAGGTYLHVSDGAHAERVVGRAVPALLDPVVRDLRLVVDWGPGVSQVRRLGNDHDRLADLSGGRGAGAGAVGRELGAGDTALVVYEVTAEPGRSLGRVRVRSTPVGSGPRTEAVQLPEVGADLARASDRLQRTAAAVALAALLDGTAPPERAPAAIALAEGSQRAGIAEDAELAEIVRLAAPMVSRPRCW